MKLLIFGSSGQLGKCLLPLLEEYQLELPSSKDVDFSQVGAVHDYIQSNTANYVLNLAAYTAVDKAESEPELANQINHLAVKEMATACTEKNLPLLHVSTDFVFDGSQAKPYTTDSDCSPLGTYGESKRAGEQAIQRLGPERSIILRTAWLYSDQGANFMLSMLRLMRERSKLTIVADQVGTPTSAHSLAQVIHKFLPTEHRGVYHWTDAGVASWYDFAVAIYEEARARDLVPAGVEITPIPSEDFPTPASRPAFSVLDKSDTYHDINAPQIHWRQELRSVLDKLATDK